MSTPVIRPVPGSTPKPVPVSVCLKVTPASKPPLKVSTALVSDLILYSALFSARPLTKFGPNQWFWIVTVTVDNGY